MKSFFVIFLLAPFILIGQADLPSEGRITTDGRLTFGGNKTEGFYDIDIVNKLEILLSEPNWFALLDGPGGRGGGEGEELIGTLIFNDTLQLDSVLVSIKGQTSDSRNDSEKKSFAIKIDDILDQKLMGYDNLNLNCAFEDHAGMREVLYYDISRGFATALKGNFVDLYINGQSWGPYNNIQQVEGTYISEWFTDNDGSRWRANPGVGGGGGPGGGGPGNPDPGRFGAGTNTLNYNGPDTTDYVENYTLKKSSKSNPWEDLITACDKLNNTPIEDLYTELNPVLDIDRSLWFLAQEIVFSDDDGYFFKGGMDYYVYWDNETGRIMPLEVDGNSVMNERNFNWSPFFRLEDTRFPLINRMLQNQEIRQRYLAHLRHILSEHFVADHVNERVDVFASILDRRVQDDPKKLYSYDQFLVGVSTLKQFVIDRAEFLNNHEDINREGLVVNELTALSSGGSADIIYPDEDVFVEAEVIDEANKVILYYGLGLDGVYERVEMKDDGFSSDETAGDGKYVGTIPSQKAGSYVRYYIEVIKEDQFQTASFYPPGAEHNVFIYSVQQSRAQSSDVVINEFLAVNDITVSDNAGEFDDWIELFNNGTEEADLTGHFLSDNEGEFDKWQFPDNTIIPAEGYLIIWADDDEEQTTIDTIHSNFKLSAGGEILTLSNPDGEILDQVDFDEQKDDISFARVPNGTGDFEFRTTTFEENNENSTTSIVQSEFAAVRVYPNPVKHVLNIDFGDDKIDERSSLQVINMSGQVVLTERINRNSTLSKIDVAFLSGGSYIMMITGDSGTIYTRRKLTFIK